MKFDLRIYSKHTIYATIFIGFLFLMPFVRSASALDIQNLDYQIDNQIINQNSEHVMNFETISPIVVGNSISINFPAQFNFASTPVQSDVEVRVNGVLLGVSDWSFSQALNTIFIAFQTTAAAGSDVEITLTDDIDLINPSNTQEYTINFGVNGSFVAAANVWIFPQSSITVNAVVLGDPIVVGGGSSGGGSTCYNCFFNDTKPFFNEQGIIISFKGYGPPQGKIQLSIDDQVVGTSSIDNKGVFVISVDNIAEGLHIFKFVGFDRNNNSTGPQLLSLAVGDRGFVYANDVFLPPTITVEPRGDYGLVFYGYTIPYAEVDLEVDGYFIGTLIANGTGLYFFETSLEQFDIGNHTVTSFLKGATRNLSSQKKIFAINPLFNSKKKELDFIGDPLFDVLLSTQAPSEKKSLSFAWLPYAISFAVGAGILWGVLKLLAYRRKREPYISQYEIH